MNRAITSAATFGSRPLRSGSAAVLLACAFLVGCSSEEKKVDPVVAVETAPAQRTGLDEIVAADAILFPLHEAAITAKVNAPVREFYVQRASKVRSGQLLAVLENRDLSAAEMQSKGDFEQAQATYETTTGASLPEDLQKAELDEAAARQTLDAQQKVYEARQKLFTEGALPRRDLDQAQVAFIQAKNQFDVAQKHRQNLLAVGKQQTLKSASGQLASAKGKYLGATAQLSYTEIRSPIDGVVTDRPLYPGEMASTSAPMITVMDISHIVARAHIPQEQAATLKLGNAATIAAPGVDDKIPGKVTVISPALDPNSTTVEVWVQADNANRLLRPGSTVKLSIVAAKHPNAVVVPAAALLKNEDGTTVMVAGSDGRAHQQKVTVGAVTDGQAQITDGLQAGQQVVTKGAYGLPDKTKITVASAEDKKEEPKKGSDDKKDSDDKD